MDDRIINVSIIIPVYNVEEYLRDALDSALNQSLDCVEVIAIDDGSTDGSHDILKEYLDEYKNLTVIQNSNHGLGYTRNEGVKCAKGKYILLLDSDDYLHLDAAKKCFEISETNDLDVLLFDSDCFKDSYETRYSEYSRSCLNIDERVYSGYEIFSIQYNNLKYTPLAQLCFISKNYLESNNISFVPDLYWEDNLYHIQIMKNASKVRHISDVLYYRRIRPDSITTSACSIKHVVDGIKISQLMFAEASEKFIDFYFCSIDTMNVSIERCRGNTDLINDVQIRLAYAEAIGILLEKNISKDIDLAISMSMYRFLMVFKDGIDEELNQHIKSYIEKSVRMYLNDIINKDFVSLGIYGTGERAEIIYSMIKQSIIHKEISYVFFDTKMESEKHRYKDHWIYNIADINNVSMDAIIVSSIKYKKEMLNEIYKYMKPEKQIRIYSM